MLHISLKMKTLKTICTFFAFSIVFIACAQNKEVVIKTNKLSENIYMLEGRGGNIGVSVGDDGVIMIDSQFAPLSPKILAAIKKLSHKDIKFLVNTHHHGDHTGGNGNMSKLGTQIVAHDNVRKRIKANANQSDESLPIITFSDKLSIHINGEQALIFHVENAHTDGDVMLYFTESNILHTGDTYFNERYPYIDLNSGGSIDGYINAIKSALILIDDDTKIIPGHGKLSNKKEYQFFLSMLKNLKTLVLDEIDSEKTEDEVANNTSLTKKYDDLNYSWNFITSEKIRRTFYKGLKK